MGEQRDSERSLVRRLVRAEVVVVVVLLIIAGISLYVRVVLPHDRVFMDGAVWFRGTDPWYHMRHIDNLIRNFPHVNSFDPYMLYPGGGSGPGRPFFDLLVAGAALLLGLGSPGQQLIDTVGAYAPAILGTLLVVPVYIIGRELFNRTSGILAAALVAILPGEFLNRSLLGFTDHHVAESLFSTTAIMFLILAVKRTQEADITLRHVLAKDWNTIRKPLILALLAGVFLAFYLLSWAGALLFVFIIFAWLVIQFVIDHLRGRQTEYLAIVGTACFAITTLIFVCTVGSPGAFGMYNASLLIALLTPVALGALSYIMSRRRLRPVVYPAAVVGAAGISFAVLKLANPSLVSSMLRRFEIFAPTGARLTILEAHPLFSPHGEFSGQIAWLNFTTSFYIAIAALLVLVVASIRHERPPLTLFLVWSIIAIAAVLGQRRFSYYTAINAGILTGYLSWKLLDLAGLAKLHVAREVRSKVYTTKAERRKRKQKASEQAAPRGQLVFRPAGAWLKVILAAFLVFFMVFFPCVGLPGMKSSTKVFGLPVKLTQPLGEQRPLIDAAWYNSLRWLRDNSPEPFGDPDFYYQQYEKPFTYPDSTYALMSWWDYGYWMVRISHRVPNSNPSQGHARQVANFFISQNETAGNEIAQRMRSGYVVIDHAMVSSKFYAMPRWARSSLSNYYDTYYQKKEDGTLQNVTLFYPGYFQSMVARLYNFDGKEVNPGQDSIIAIKWARETDAKGNSFKLITGSWTFASYSDAKGWTGQQEDPAKYRIVNPNPFNSPVPLEALDTYKLVYESPQKVSFGDKKVAAIKIFKHRLQAGGS